MSLTYPRKLTAPYGAFLSADPPVIKKPPPKPEGEAKKPALKLSFSTTGASPLPVAEHPKLIGITRVALFVDGNTKADAASVSFNNGDASEKNKEIAPFFFCPGADTVRIGWKMRNEQAIAKATVEIHAARLDGAICKKEISGGALTKDPKTQGTDAPLRCTGSLLLTDVMTWTGTHDAEFPDRVLTAQHSPYQLRITVEKKPDGSLSPEDKERDLYPSVAWSFFHVLVDHLELEWGDPTKVPAGGPPGVDGTLQATTTPLETTLVNNLVGTPLATNDLAALVRQQRAGARPAVAKVELPLPVELYDAAAPDGGEVAVTSNRDAIVKTWGDGPRIPLKAKVFIRRADGSAATFNDSMNAVGKLQMMWDWSDDGTRWIDWCTPGQTGHSLLTQELLQRAFAKVEPSSPHGSANCPVSFGGRRGAVTKPVFPAQVAGTFGFDVRDGQGTPRAWSSVGTTGTGADKGTTAAIFHPSPFPGDQYRVHVYVTGAADATAGARTGCDDKPDLRIAEPGKPLHEAVFDEASPPAHAPNVPVFEVYRKAPIVLINVGTPMPALTLNAIAARYKRELHIILDAQIHALPQNWLQTGTRLKDLKDDLAINIFTVASKLGLKTQPPNFGTHLLHVRTFADFIADLPAIIETGGKLYTFTRDGGQFEEGLYPRNGTVGWGCRDAFATTGPAQPADHFIVDAWRVGKKGTLWQYVMFVETGGAAPANGQVMKGQAIAGVKELIPAELEVVRVDPTGAQAANVIKVKFVAATTATEVTITYGKKGFRKLVQRSVPKADATVLGNTFAGFAANPARVTRGVRFRIEMVAPDPAGDARDSERLRRLERLLRKLYDEAGCFISTQRVVGAVTGAITLTEYFQHLDMKILRSVKTKVTQLILADYPAARGAVSVYFEKLSDADPNSSGGAFKSGTTQRRTCLYVIAGVAPVTRARQYDTEEVFAHELLHLFFRGPHAKSRVFGFGDVGSNETDHLSYDGCLMNYDAEPTTSYFCGGCMLLLRGWTLDAATAPKADGAQLARAVTFIDQEINAATDLRVKAWKQLRKAHLAWKQNAPATIESAALAGLASWEKAPGVDWHGPERVSLLRSVILALRAANKIDRAYDLRQKLGLLTEYTPDLAGFGDELAGDTLHEVQLLDAGDAPATESVTQLVNLPRDAKFVDGTVVLSEHRLGRRVTVKLVFPDPGKHPYTVQLLGHRDNLDYSDEERMKPALNFAGTDIHPTVSRPDYPMSYGAALTGKTDSDGTKRLELELPPTGGNSYIVVATAGGRTAESFPIDTERLLFMQRVRCQNAIPDVPAAQAFTDKLNETFVPLGIRFAHVGDSDLAGHPYFDSRDTQCARFLGDAANLATAPSTWNGQTFAALRPHLVQIVFAKQVLGEAAHGRIVRDGVTGGATITLDVKDQRGSASTLWLGEPAAHHSTVVNPSNVAHYLGNGSVQKPWLLWGSFAGQDLQLTDVVGVEDDSASFPLRCGKIDVNLTRFGAAAGSLAVQVLTTRWVGGVSLKSEWQIAIASRPPFAAAADSIDKQLAKVVHEIGHLIGMVPRYFHGPSGATLPAGPTGIDGPSTWYSHDGSHCAQGLPNVTDVAKYRDHKDIAACRRNSCADIPECVMFGIGTEPPITTFCSHCAPRVRKIALVPFDQASPVWLSR